MASRRAKLGKSRTGVYFGACGKLITREVLLEAGDPSAAGHVLYVRNRPQHRFWPAAYVLGLWQGAKRFRWTRSAGVTLVAGRSSGLPGLCATANAVWPSPAA